MRKIVENYSDSDYWYRKYDDGLIEQGGKLLKTWSTDETYAFTFPRPFSSTPLYMLTTVINPRSGGDSYGNEFGVKTSTLSSTGVTILNDEYNTGKKGFYWEAAGY